MDWPPSSTKRRGAGHDSVADFTLLECAKSKCGGMPESPGERQYVFHPRASRSSTPARSVDPSGIPEVSRTAERVSPSHAEASAARACGDASAIPSANPIVPICRNAVAYMTNRLQVIDGERN